MFLLSLFRIISALIVILIATPTFGIVIIPLGIFYLLIQVYIIASMHCTCTLQPIYLFVLIVCQCN